MLERIYPEGAPAPRGPYSPAVRAGDFIYVSGQGPVDPATNEMSLGDIDHETRLTLDNIKRILEAAGASLDDVIRCGVFLRYASDFKPMNAIYEEYFGTALPARTTVVTEFVNLDMKVEIDCVAYKPVAR